MRSRISEEVRRSLKKDGMAIESRNSGALDNFAIKTMRNGGPERLLEARKNSVDLQL